MRSEARTTHLLPSAWEALNTSACYQRNRAIAQVTSDIEGPGGTVKDHEFRSECGLPVV
jgi:hypothetical protein